MVGVKRPRIITFIGYYLIIAHGLSLLGFLISFFLGSIIITMLFELPYLSVSFIFGIVYSVVAIFLGINLLTLEDWARKGIMTLIVIQVGYIFIFSLIYNPEKILMEFTEKVDAKFEEQLENKLGFQVDAETQEKMRKERLKALKKQITYQQPIRNPFMMLEFLFNIFIFIALIITKPYFEGEKILGKDVFDSLDELGGLEDENLHELDLRDFSQSTASQQDFSDTESYSPSYDDWNVITVEKGSDVAGKTCLVCRKKLHSGDEAAVCPRCNAPYHRKCHDRLGRCCSESCIKSVLE